MTRAPRRLLRDADILQAALAVITKHGIDQLGIPQIAHAAGVTSAPVYRRYDSADDIITELWSTSLRQHFVRSARAALTWSSHTADTSWLEREILHPSLESRALIETLAVSRRLGPAGAAIRSDFEHDLTELVTSSARLPPVLVLASLTPVLGAWLLGPFAPAVLPAVIQHYPAFSAEYARPEHWALESRQFAYVPPAPLRWATNDNALDDLRLAAVHVASQFGVANTTANRIARRAGRSLNTAYRRLGTKDELVAEAVAMALNSEFGFSGSETASSMPFAPADRMARSLQVLRNHIDERNLAHRSFLLEALLAARHSTDIERSVTEWFAAIFDRFAEGAAAIGGPDIDLIIGRWQFRIASGVGSLVLSMASSQFANRYDPMPAVAANDAAVATLFRPAVG